MDFQSVGFYSRVSIVVGIGAGRYSTMRDILRLAVRLLRLFWPTQGMEVLLLCCIEHDDGGSSYSLTLKIGYTFAMIQNI